MHAPMTGTLTRGIARAWAKNAAVNTQETLVAACALPVFYSLQLTGPP